MFDPPHHGQARLPPSPGDCGLGEGRAGRTEEDPGEKMRLRPDQAGHDWFGVHQDELAVSLQRHQQSDVGPHARPQQHKLGWRGLQLPGELLHGGVAVGSHGAEAVAEAGGWETLEDGVASRHPAVNTNKLHPSQARPGYEDQDLLYKRT